MRGSDPCGNLCALVSRSKQSLPRLQELIKKHLRVDRTHQAIRWMTDRGVMVRGFFMLGFPTETLDEIRRPSTTRSKASLTQAYFFNVVPQPGTPLYDLAFRRMPPPWSRRPCRNTTRRRRGIPLAYGVNMQAIMKWAYIRFLC